MVDVLSANSHDGNYPGKVYARPGRIAGAIGAPMTAFF